MENDDIQSTFYNSKTTSKISKSSIISSLSSPFSHISFSKLPQKKVNSIVVYPESKSSLYKFSLHLSYQVIYETISEFYYPLLKHNNCVNYSTVVNRVEKVLNNNNSVFMSNKEKENLFLTKSKNKEMIAISLLIEIMQIKFDEDVSCDVKNKLYSEIFNVLKRLYKLSMLFIIFDNKNTKEDDNNMISFKSLCMKYVNANIKQKYFDITHHALFKKIKTSLLKIRNKLSAISFTLLSFLYHSTSHTEISSFLLNKNILLRLQIIEQITLHLSSHHSSFSYTALRSNALSLLSILHSLHSYIAIPYLPSIRHHTYSLVIDLDETLIHFALKTNCSYVNIRPYTNFFINTLSKYYELIIFTAAIEEYADYIVEQIDPEHHISHKLYRRHTVSKDNKTIKDLNKIGREIDKVCIIDNNKENFSLQPENGIEVRPFIDDENDDELLVLANELVRVYKMIIKNDTSKDFRTYIRNIQNKIQKRNDIV